MSVFGEYSRYYDLIYRDKDYAAEAEYVHGLVQRFRPGASRMLDLGCGTGRHGELFAGKGYEVTGVDISANSIAAARSRRGDMEFLLGDIRDVRLGRTFDAVVSLFHVMSYQTTNAALMDAFRTAREHLEPGGVFLFDCWYGPGVLTDRPTVRQRDFTDGTLNVRRLAEPTMRPDEDIVDVDYTVTVIEGGVEVGRFSEKHVMRYLFRPEVEMMLGMAGFELAGAFEWMCEASPGLGSWNACFVGRA